MLDDTFLPRGMPAPPQRIDVIRLGAFQERSQVAGPGQRAVVWVTGCLRRCPECIKPNFLPFDAGEDVAVRALAQRILDIRQIDGVTLSGGEPFEQALALGSLCRILRNHSLSVVAYSGYTLEALRAQPERFESLLSQVDLLIDGEYRRELPGPFTWRGSANQQLHALTMRGQVPELPAEPLRQVQASLRPEALRLTGFPDRAMEEQLANELAARGISIKRVK